jgi:recombination protein RecA
MVSPSLLSPRGLFAPEDEYFRAVEPRSPDYPSKKSASPDLSSLPRHAFPAHQVDNRDLSQLTGVTRASLLEVRSAPATLPSGIAQLDAITSGIPRGALTEIFGPASSGRSSVLLALLAEITRRQEVCALVDVSDSFHPHSAAAAGVDLDRLLWIRCGVASTEFRVVSTESQSQTRHPERSQGPALSGHAERRQRSAVLSHSQLGTRYSALPSSCLRGETNSDRRHFFRALEQALKVTDLLLQSSGFGLIAMDLGDIPSQIARRVPLTSWFRFRRAVENTPTILLVMEQEPYAKTCASLVLKMYPQSALLSRQHAVPTAELPTHARLLRGLGVTAELVRSRLDRKPPVSVAGFETRTAATSF